MGLVSGFVCDKCGFMALVDKVGTKKALVCFARKKGWTVGKKVCCPNCKQGGGKQTAAGA